jgi:Arc/MetJ family transcription regulator
MISPYIANIKVVIMSNTQIDLDDEALAAAMKLMGTTTKKDTVNLALRDYVERVRRLEAFERLAERGARGEFDQAAKAHEDAKQARRAAFE